MKNTYLTQERSLTRKAREMLLALKVDRRLSRDEILEGYLNTSYFGRNACGVQAAVRAYFGKDVSELNAPEGAYLATLLNAPGVYDLTAHPENRPRVEARWNYVLDGMVGQAWLSSADRAAMTFPELAEPQGRAGPVRAARRPAASSCSPG